MPISVLAYITLQIIVLIKNKETIHLSIVQQINIKKIVNMLRTFQDPVHMKLARK